MDFKLLAWEDIRPNQHLCDSSETNFPNGEFFYVNVAIVDPHKHQIKLSIYNFSV